MDLPRTSQCDPKCRMCFQDGKCPFRKTIEDLLKTGKIIPVNDQALQKLVFIPVR
jgi:hypothetical protein